MPGVEGGTVDDQHHDMTAPMQRQVRQRIATNQPSARSLKGARHDPSSPQACQISGRPAESTPRRTAVVQGIFTKDTAACCRQTQCSSASVRLLTAHPPRPEPQQRRAVAIANHNGFFGCPRRRSHPPSHCGTRPFPGLGSLVEPMKAEGHPPPLTRLPSPHSRPSFSSYSHSPTRWRPSHLTLVIPFSASPLPDLIGNRFSPSRDFHPSPSNGPKLRTFDSSPPSTDGLRLTLAFSLDALQEIGIDQPHGNSRYWTSPTSSRASRWCLLSLRPSSCWPRPSCPLTPPSPPGGRA